MSAEPTTGSRFPEEAEVLARTLEDALVRTRDAAKGADAAAPPKPARRSTRKQLWEYQVELLHDPQGGWFQLWEDREIAALGTLLNQRGQEGWELVWYGPSPFAAAGSPPRFLAVFKRPANKAASARAASRTGTRRRSPAA